MIHATKDQLMDSQKNKPVYCGGHCLNGMKCVVKKDAKHKNVQQLYLKNTKLIVFIVSCMYFLMKKLPRTIK